jgi:hypothetical protein
MVMTPIEADALRTKLNEGTVQFAFKKLDGTLRTAVGTTSLETVPMEHHPSGDGGESSRASVRYFDMGKNAWRSVSSTQEIFLAE